MSEYTTVFGRRWRTTTGPAVSHRRATPKAYVFSNVFEVANTSKPYKEVAVGTEL